MIVVYNDNLKQKSEQIKVMSIEIDMYETQVYLLMQVKEYKFEIERLQKDHQNLKKKFFEQKKRELYDQNSMN